MAFDLSGAVPTPGNWFAANLKYSGKGTARFVDPAGTISGGVAIRYTDSSDSSIEMSVQDVSSSVPLHFGIMEMLHGQAVRKPNGTVELVAGNTLNPCRDIKVQTDEWVFSAHEDVSYGYTHMPSRTKLQFHPLWAQFDVTSQSPATYWVLPLTNFISSFREQNPVLDRHPLRIYPTPIIPEDLPEDIAWRAKFRANSRNGLIIFAFGDTLGFVEPLPDYDKRVQKLLKGQVQRITTAVMVGEVGARSIDFADVRAWLPVELLRLLSLATGSEVGASWVEFRDAGGGLVKRIHSSLGTPLFSKGHRNIDEGIHRGTGRLLSKALSSPEFQQPFWHVASKYFVLGALQNSALDDRMDHLCRGLDMLCEHYDVAAQRLMDQLDQEQQERVRKALTEAGNTVRSLASDAGKSGNYDQSRALGTIAGRISNAANKENKFGLSVAALLKKFGLPDADLMDAYYQTHPHFRVASWADVLSDYRAAVVHVGYFDVTGMKYNVDDILNVINHLHDIGVRLIFKMLEYDATYQPAVLVGTAKRTVDWVTSATPADELGYS